MPLPKPLRLAVVACATACLAVAVSSMARDDKPAKAPDAAPSAADLAAFMKDHRPGEQHARLRPFVGTFDVEMEITPAPGAPPQKSKGRQKADMVLDGRYLHGDFTGDLMGMPFHGNSLMGYDLQKKKYFSAWVDNMSTGLLVFEGTFDAAGKVLTFTGEYDDEMTGKHTKVRDVTTIVSPDQYQFEWFETGPDGKENKTMAGTYTRAK